MSALMPALFIGHGSPMNAIETNACTRAWADVGRRLPTPKAILVVSAHWETVGTAVTAMQRPTTLYDFQGFPPELYSRRYPAPGAPELARRIATAGGDPVIHLDFGWGLDHGSWSVLMHLFPAADVPVLQISLDFEQSPRWHYALGRELAWLRREGVLVIGSGNLVHNLRRVVWEDRAFDWAEQIDARIADNIRREDHQSLIDYEQLHPQIRLAVPTEEHYLPLLYLLGMRQAGERLIFFCETVTLGSISMRAFQLG